MEFYKWKKGGDINLKGKLENKKDMWLLIVIIIGGGGEAGNKVGRCGEKEKGKKALRGERFIYYNNLYWVICKNFVRKVKLKKTKVNLIIKGNNNR